jgi:TPP-dependent trihydroxycyclohexane-1,2-dione (THcHDO) dehydratase
MKELTEAIKDFTVLTKDFFAGIGKIFHYVTHPVELLSSLWNLIEVYSGPVTLLVFLMAMILYVIGYEKSKKFISGSFFTYVVIQMIGATIK